MTDTDIQAQADDLEPSGITLSDEPQEIEGSDQPTEQQEQPEKVTFDERQQKTVDNIVTEKVKKQREAERRADAAEAKLAEIEAAKPKEVRPDVPDVPDPYDDSYEADIQARDEALLKAADFDARQRFMQEQNQANQRRAIEEDNAKQAENYKGFLSRGSEAGISPEELRESGQKVAAFGITNGIAQHLLNSDEGHLIAAYLGREEDALKGMTGMNEVEATLYLNNVVLPEARDRFKTKPKPDPIDSLDGAGVTAKERGPSGARFE